MQFYMTNAELEIHQAYTSQIVVIIIMALAIGVNSISTQSRRESIIRSLSDLPGMLSFCIEICILQPSKDLNSISKLD